MNEKEQIDDLFEVHNTLLSINRLANEIKNSLNVSELIDADLQSIGIFKKLNEIIRLSK